MERKRLVDIIVKVLIAALSALAGAITQACAGLPL